MQNLQSLKELLVGKPKNIVITTHQKPDADALGSSLGLYNYLKKYHHNICVVAPTDYPRFLFWMPGNNCVINYEENDYSKNYINKAIDNADIIFCLDYSSWERLKKVADSVKNSKAIKVLIDHHLDPTVVAEYKMWYPSAAATCELIYNFICQMGDKNLIDSEIGECIYAGIMTDTGSFRFPSTSKNIHIIISELIEIGVDNSKVHRLIYDNNSQEKLRFLGFVLNQKLHVIDSLNTAYIAISSEELSMFNSQTGDTEGLVNYALSIEGVVFAVIIIEREDAVKMSFRSSGNFKANEFAALHFEGGGHKNAAGGKSNASFKDTLEKFLNILPSYQQMLNAEYQSQPNLIPC
ncbi:MAG: bifunctional oligoribonuclease/PAP phosphatase NrnA [Cytophagales bacterium]|nr:MAG: bifunctional oligoribonuclease/PAP phosphatase NrnA [Cytophagales bacterium]